MPGSAASCAIAASGSGCAPSSSAQRARDAAPARARRCSCSRARDPERREIVDVARAMRAGVGVSRVSVGNGVASGSPNAATSRPASVVAALTVTCWPRIARTPISKPRTRPERAGPGSPRRAAPGSGPCGAARDHVGSRVVDRRGRARAAAAPGSTGSRLCVSSSGSAGFVLRLRDPIHPVCDRRAERCVRRRRR